MSTIPIDHLSRDDLVTLLYRIAAKLATPPVEFQATRRMPDPVATHPSWNFPEAQRGCHSTMKEAQKSLVPPYEEEHHDPWNAHLRRSTSAPSGDVSFFTGPSDVLPPAPPPFIPPFQRDEATTTRLSDAMTTRYAQSTAPGTSTCSYQPCVRHTTAAIQDPVGPTQVADMNAFHCSCTCKHCDRSCCLRKKDHAVHLCLLHKIP